MTVETQGSSALFRVLNVLGAALPFALLGWYMWLLKPPPPSVDVLSVAGTWEIFDQNPLTAGDDLKPVRTIEMPSVAVEEPSRGVFWARKTFELAPSMEGQRLALYLGEGWTSVATAYLNGHRVGRDTTADNRVKTPPRAPMEFVIPAEFVRPGQNVLDVELDYIMLPDTAFGDAAAVIGTERSLGVYLVRRASIEVWLPSASIYLGFVFIAVLLALWSLDARVSPDAAGRYVTPLVTLSATMFWVLFAKSAHVASWVPNRTWLFALHMAVVGFCVMTAVEFSIWFWESPRTRVGRWASRVMRFISVAHAALLMYFAVRDQPENINSTYVAFGALFVPALLYASSLGIVRLFRGDRRPFGVVMASTLCAILFAGIHDIVRERMELGPPIFPAGVIIFGVFEALVVLGGFLQVAVRNIELSTSLSAANVELERALVMADEANRSKAEFLANISHEMRTPLNAIVHLPVALARNFEVGTDGSGRFVGDAEAVRADLVHIAKSSRGLYRVINDILDISRLEAGAEKLHVEQVDPVVLARRALGATRAFAATRDIDIRVTMPEPGAITMEGDPARIVQVLENLLSNAIQFSHQGGVVELSLRSDERAVHFSVRDEGVGIDAAHHALIFESFRQVESGNKRGTTGSGLGLAITKCVVDLHGGEIRLKSARGEGATFDVTFPRGVPISMAS